MTNDDTKVAKSSPVFECKTCDYTTCKKSNYKKHLDTNKHKTLQNNDINVAKVAKPSVCLCGKEFKYRQNLWAHKKKCENIDFNLVCTTEEEKIDFMKQLLIQNQQVIFDNQEFKNMIIEMSNKPSNITNNSNCNNNTNNTQFNLQVFLNEKCKNAMNMSDFINSIKIENDDFEDIGKLGYVQGISNIFIKNLKKLDESLRPMHCSDIKRETIYVKDNNVWTKDSDNKKVRHVIAMIAYKNFKYIPIWTEANPSAFDCRSKKNDQYLRLTNQVTTAITPDDDAGICKIIRNVANQVVIDKRSAMSTNTPKSG